MSALVQAAQVADALGDYVVLAVHWTDTAEQARAQYDAEHLPGAIFVDGVRDFARAPREGEGRNPIPDAEVFQQSLRNWGIRSDSQILLYDRAKTAAATRAWWVLRHAGVENVSVLDGGLKHWRALGLPVTTDEPAVSPSEIAIEFGSLRVVTADEVAELLSDGLVIDARSPERYAGVPHALDPRPGHAPGAVNSFWESQFDDEGLLLPAEVLRQRFEEVGVKDGVFVANYCGSGVSATLNIFALEVAGFPGTALYPGSWSEWAADERRPVVVA